VEEQKMLYRRKTYKINPQQLEVFNEFFHTYLLPNQLKHGAKLVGRWVTEAKDEIMAIWEYKDYETYEKIEQLVREDELHCLAKKKLKEISPLYLESKQDFLMPTGDYHYPKHIVSVSGFITNKEGEVLLIRTRERKDTWEMPGGQVEKEETLEEAVHREIKEETGLNVNLHGITGIYHNINMGIVNIVFRGEAKEGEFSFQEDEVLEAKFILLTSENIDQFITYPQLKNRLLDAMNPIYLPYESFRMKPYEILTRFEAKKEGSFK
jgi:8-oxo-dGTP diphosphatase